MVEEITLAEAEHGTVVIIVIIMSASVSVATFTAGVAASSHELWFLMPRFQLPFPPPLLLLLFKQ